MTFFLIFCLWKYILLTSYCLINSIAQFSNINYSRWTFDYRSQVTRSRHCIVLITWLNIKQGNSNRLFWSDALKLLLAHFTVNRTKFIIRLWHFKFQVQTFSFILYSINLNLLVGWSNDHGLIEHRNRWFYLLPGTNISGCDGCFDELELPHVQGQ